MALPVEQPGPSRNDRLFALALSVLPHHLLSRLMYAATRWEWPPFKRRLVRWAVKHYGIDMGEAVEPEPDRYPCFNAFFTRALKPGARPVDSDPATIVSPVDGQVSQAGVVNDDRLFQAKGRYFSLEELLGDAELAARFRSGSFAILYLSPRDYHRIHMPLDGRLEQMIHIPGRLFSVNHATVRAVPRLFARNERIVTLFDTPAGPAAVILVGAIFVGSMETVWAGTVTPVERRISRWHYGGGETRNVVLAKGQEMGRFNMGSTVILLFPEDRVVWDSHLVAKQHVRFGQRIARMPIEN
jgi:phosphatidylserine decarboxylase